MQLHFLTSENDEDEVVLEEIEERRPVSLQQAREATQEFALLCFS